jgi:PilZ domain/Gram-negative bacterial TonB protein C-terminal
MMHFVPGQLTEFLGSSDRRARVRRSPSAVAYLEVGEGNGGIVLNVSETGMAIAAAQSFVETQIPSLTFRLPQLDRTFQASGEIMWRSESQKSAGIRFTNLPEPDRAQIRNWIRAEIVAAELQTPQERERARAAAKSVLIMPSPRKVARQVEFEAARDEARAAEFDRMFPSEASLNATLPIVEAESNSEIAQAAKAENAANAFLVHEEFVRETLGPEVPRSESEHSPVACSGFPVVEPANDEISVATDWRDEWEQFHRRRENLERARRFELTEPLAMQSIIGEPIVEETAAGPNRSDSEWLADKPEPLIFEHADIVEGPGTTVNGNPREREKSPLGVAALSTVLVVMCFILGYAIQPGAFRFVVARLVDADKGASTPTTEGQSAEESEPSAAAPALVQDASDPAPVSDAEGERQMEKTRPVTAAENPDAPENSAGVHSIQRPAVDPAPIQPVAKTAAPAISSPMPPAPAEARKLAPSMPAAPRVSNTTSPGATGAGVAMAPVPVSFFPVTAPAGGSAPKLMQLPEETISETPAIVTRSRQFLFVPPQPGPESAHELERVHIGDRIVKVDPQQSLGSTQGGSVHLRATIGIDGAVSDVLPISGPTALIPVAVSALRQWRYKPTDIDGTPIAMEEDVIFEFRASH